MWDQHARFEIELGPLSLEDFESFLPNEWRFGVLCDLVRFYVKDELEFNVRLILKADEIPDCRAEHANRLFHGRRGLVQGATSPQVQTVTVTILSSTRTRLS